MTIRNLWHRGQDRAYGFRSPDKLPKGRVLVHNHVKHTLDMPDDLNGFRCWTQEMDNREELVRCGCGWQGVEHYRVHGLGDDKSYTWEEIMRVVMMATSRQPASAGEGNVLEGINARGDAEPFNSFGRSGRESAEP